jgi:hypothetical protein
MLPMPSFRPRFSRERLPVRVRNIQDRPVYGFRRNGKWFEMGDGVLLIISYIDPMMIPESLGVSMGILRMSLTRAFASISIICSSE